MLVLKALPARHQEEIGLWLRVTWKRSLRAIRHFETGPRRCCEV